MSNIEWTEQTWNPIVGCSKISEGCRNCYAINQSHRNGHIALARLTKGENLGRLDNYIWLTEKRGDRIEWTGDVRFVEDALDIPRKRKKPTMYFVNSMSDMFHENVPYTWFKDIIRVCRETPQHTYQILTKRSERMKLFVTWFHKSEPGGFPSNVWLGVTVENQKAVNERSWDLLTTPASVHFLSCEPLLEDIEIWDRVVDYRLKWVIVGGESGHNCRPCNQEWIQSVVDQCIDLNVPVFVKQLGGFPDKRHDFDLFPSSLQYRQMPKGVSINA